jgi:hypothetical protein
MKRKDNKNRLDELLSKHLKKKTDDFDFQKWQTKFPQEAACLKNMHYAQKKTKTIIWSLIWRIIMKSPYTKYGTIAAAFMIAIIFLFSDVIIPSSGILLADVQKKVMDQKSCLITGTRVLTTNSKETKTTELTVHKYLSYEYGYLDQTFDEKGNLFVSISVHHPSKVVTVLLPQTKRYIQFPIPKEYQEKMKDITPLKLFALIMYSSDGKDIEKINFKTFDITKVKGTKKSQVQGISAIGFETFDLHKKISHEFGFSGLSLLFDMQKSRACIWINPKTLLPIELEAEVNLGKCIFTNFKEMNLIEVDGSFEWNIEMDETIFNPEIPEDYQLFGAPEIKNTAAIGASGAAIAIPLFFWMKKRRGRNYTV